MRVLAAALAVLLLVAVCSMAQADLRDSGNAGLSKKAFTDTVPTFCCFTTISRPLRRSTIQSAYRTSNMCTTAAVVLVTKNGKQVCADPKARWLQKYLEDFELLDF